MLIEVYEEDFKVLVGFLENKNYKLHFKFQ